MTEYLVIDRSSSSSGLKWDASKAGLKSFFEDPASAGISAGLVTFPRQPLLNKEECNFINYQDPQVPFGELPTNAKPILDFLETVKPDGFGTPIYPALGGALQRAALTKQSKPNENFVVLLVTDGEAAQPPATCNGVDVLKPDSPGGIYELVSKAFSQFGIRTFVIGFPGIPAQFAQTLAQKGGTEAAVIQNTLDLQKQFQDALAAVRGQALGCVFPLPAESKEYATDELNVSYLPGNGAQQNLGRSVGCKEGQGWDYDNSANPAGVVLCGQDCDKAMLTVGGNVLFQFGCPTVLLGGGGVGGAGGEGGQAGGNAGQGGAGAAGSGGQGTISCPVGLLACGDQCINTKADKANCGQCGKACKAGEVCSSGTCQASCQPWLSNCDGACINTQSDPQNCGSCGNKCDQGEVCSGSCSLSCQPGLTQCGGSCVNTKTDPQNCGGCGKPCDSGQVCSNGTCTLSCQAGLTQCKGLCVNAQTDNANCGGCNLPCGAGKTCSGGQCSAACQPGFSQCGQSCADLQNDSKNCGQCSKACDANQACSGGGCILACPAGTTPCGGDCTNTDNDVNNCGSCGKKCAANEACTAGSCSPSCGGLVYFEDNFANNSKGWGLGTEWQIAPAKVSSGQSKGYPDPSTDHTASSSDNGVAGVKIGGNASTASLHGYYYLTSPPINTTGSNPVILEYWRWLNSDHTPYMQNVVEVFNGSTWVTVFQTGGSPGVADDAWTKATHDVTAHRNASFRVRFGFQIQDAGVFAVSSWNLDDVRIGVAPSCNLARMLA